MIYTGSHELDTIVKSYEESASRIMQAQMQKITNELKNKAGNALKDIQLAAFGILETTAYETFQKVFTKEYGQNYEVNSLNKCLKFKIDKNLSPSVDYDSTKLIMKADYDKDQRAFNQNARYDGKFGNLVDAEELDILEEMQFYDIDIENENPYDWAESEITSEKEEDFHAWSGRENRMIKEPKYVFKDAIAETYKAYNIKINEQLPSIYNTILRRYGLKA